MNTNKTPQECARHELARRFRDPVTGAKVRGHKLRETDKRFTLRKAYVAMGTKALVELANAPEDAWAGLVGEDWQWADDGAVEFAA